jgi:hypothetical protein
MLGFAWLWSDVYKGLEISRGGIAERHKLLWIGWTKREYKARGW